MKKAFLFIFVICFGFAVSFYAKNNFFKTDFSKNDSQFMDGDIIFQASKSEQSKAIQLATHSPYSHCGIVYQQDNNWFVFEAVQPVKSTPLQQWIKRGENSSFVLKRIKEREKVLTESVLLKMKQIASLYRGKNYDLVFEWSDDKMYCSELVWKMYKQTTGLEIGKLQRLKDFDLSHSVVQQKIKERYGNKIPLDEMVISPESIFKSEYLIEVPQ